MMERNENNSAPQHSEYFAELDLQAGGASDGPAYAAALVMLSLPLGSVLWYYAITVLANAL